MTRSRERGSATIWILACCMLVALAAVAAVLRCEAVLARHRAESAADLAALAAASRIGAGDEPCAAARVVAEANDARLRSCRAWPAPDGRSGTVAVTVRIGVRLPVVGLRQVSASARAGRLPAQPGR